MGEGAEQIITGLEPNTMYSLSGFGKIEPGDGISIGVKDYGGQQQTVTFDGEAYEAQSFTFSTGPSNTTAASSCLQASRRQPRLCGQSKCHEGR